MSAFSTETKLTIIAVTKMLPFITSQGPAWVIIRFPLILVERCRNALMKNLSIHRGYRGQVSGVSRRVDTHVGGLLVVVGSKFAQGHITPTVILDLSVEDWTQFLPVSSSY